MPEANRIQRPGGAPPAPQPAVLPSDPVRSGETVTVACKLPHGLILRAFNMVDGWETIPGGSRPIKRAVEVEGLTFTIRGTAMDGNLTHEHLERIQPGGYALTYGVPKETWNRWYEDNKNGHLVRNHLIFAHGSEGDVRTEASKNPQTRSGLEPIDPDNPSRFQAPGEKLRIQRMASPNSAGG